MLEHCFATKHPLTYPHPLLHHRPQLRDLPHSHGKVPGLPGEEDTADGICCFRATRGTLKLAFYNFNIERHVTVAKVNLDDRYTRTRLNGYPEGALDNPSIRAVLFTASK